MPPVRDKDIPADEPETDRETDKDPHLSTDELETLLDGRLTGDRFDHAQRCDGCKSLVAGELQHRV